MWITPFVILVIAGSFIGIGLVSLLLLPVCAKNRRCCFAKREKKVEGKRSSTEILALELRMWTGGSQPAATTRRWYGRSRTDDVALEEGIVAWSSAGMGVGVEIGTAQQRGEIEDPNSGRDTLACHSWASKIRETSAPQGLWRRTM
ncbi:hypothetical protein LTR56_018301 [Elasticomyces elasticus]|nr:hypothetical protein LTR56_018301 [Elasticomyces elasticus]KAK3636791.1 hypothetical protein LTR22_018606 [Elasticomyces elasticus]KAK4912346.1 hypothetical protein LTR49_019164 [Elasticomyces elasticus]KAK5751860.1 hypothetical protein LTS12_018101 [Elasticomyces elasticus]